MRRPADLPVLENAAEADIAAALMEHSVVCVGEREGEKLIAPRLPVARLNGLAPYVIAEADGSKGLPSYGPEMRGGTANCSVIVSDDPVASPLVDMADCVVAMNRPSLDKFESHVKPGGVLVINSSIIDRKAERDDIQVVYCDANGIAESVGNPKGANVAILGALMEKAPVVSNEILGEAIRIELGEKKAKFLEGNMKALEAGEAAARG